MKSTVVQYNTWYWVSRHGLLSEGGRGMRDGRAEGSSAIEHGVHLFSHSIVSDSLSPHGMQHTRLPCPLSTPRTCSNSCPSSWWCYPTISSSVVLFSSHLQSFPASGSFPMSQLFASGDQSIRVWPSASALPINILDWFPLVLTGWISLQSKGLSRVFFNTTVQKHRFFSTQLFLFISHFSGQWNRDGLLKTGLLSWLRQ